MLEGIAQGQGLRSFAKATPEQQAAVLRIAAQMDQPVPQEQATPAPVTPRAPQPVQPPEPPGKTAAQMIQEEMAAKRAAREAAAKPAPAETASPQEETQPQLEAPTSRYTASGELKSPELRGAETKGANVEAKAQRFAQAIHGFVKSSELQLIPKGKVSAVDIAKGAVPGWGNITDDLISRGLLKPDEAPPNSSIPQIVTHLKQMEAAANKAKLTGQQ
jgi:hypothetical protein